MILHTKLASNCTSPWHDEKDLFSKFVIREIQKFSYWILTFFLGKLYQKFLFSYALPTQWLLSTSFGSISTNPWPDQNDLFLKVVIREIRKFSQISVWKTNIFASQAISKIHFVLHSRIAGDTPYQVCFDLHISLTRWKRPIFKICYSRNSKISVLNTNFSPRQAIPKTLFFLCSTYTVATEYRVWFDFDKSLTWSKWPIFKSHYSRHSQIFANFRMKKQHFC